MYKTGWVKSTWGKCKAELQGSHDESRRAHTDERADDMI